MSTQEAPVTEAPEPSPSPPYQLTIDGFPEDHFRVQALKGREALSEAYWFDVVVTAEMGSSDDVERGALARRAILMLNVGGTPRVLHGVVAAVRLDAVHTSERRIKYQVRVVPRLWLLKRKRRSRIFQGMRVPDIAAAVLREAGVPTRVRLVRDYPVREHCTQYEETDYAFVTRILAEAGIYFYFPVGPALATSTVDRADDDRLPDAVMAEPLVPGETVILGDDALFYPPVGGDDAKDLFFASTGATGTLDPAVLSAPGRATTLYYLAQHETGTSDADKVTRFTMRTSVRANAAAYHEYDPDRPNSLLDSSAASNHPFAPAPTGKPLARSALEVYEHHGDFLFPKWAFADDEAPRILRQERRRAVIARGDSGCVALAPGHRFALADHPADHLDRAYVVTRVEHRGRARAAPGERWRLYTNTFECAPAEVTYVPSRPARRSVQVALTATVVGGGDGIHVSPAGQIRVRFHWDRAGSSSCWIRLMQPWAGAGWGAQFVPREGMEVVVVFEGGDPDKPMVLGALYNGSHPPPFSLPGDKTRSGWRTQSVPSGTGFNELSFQDASAKEQIYLHAQRNLDEVIERNHTLLVRNDEFIRVMGSRMDAVERNLEAHVKGDHAVSVEGNRLDAVKGNSEIAAGTLSTRVEGKEHRAVGGTADLEFADDLVTRVSGSLITVVGKPDQRRSWTTHAEGAAALSGADRLELSSDKEVLIRVGKSSLRITPDNIELNTGSLRATGGVAGLSADDDGLTLSSKGGAQILVKRKLLLKTDGASLAMLKEVKIDGSQILLNSPDVAKDPPPEAPLPPTTIALDDDRGKPLGHQRFIITLSDGGEMSGITDRDGRAELQIKSGGTIVFPDVTLLGNTEQGELRPHVVRAGDYLAKLAGAYGFDPEAIWNHPKNAALKAARGDGSILCAADVIFIPEPKRKGSPLTKGTKNLYVARVPRVEVKLALGQGGKPLAGETCVVHDIDPPNVVVTDGAGTLTVKVPATMRVLRVEIKRLSVVRSFNIGHLDPIDEPSGVRQRLKNLGHGTRDEAHLEDPDNLSRAIARFQKAGGLTPTGEMDDATRDALEKAHGC